MQPPLDQIALPPLLERLRRRANRLCADKAAAEDLTQETLLRLMETMARSPLRTPERYAMIILHNLARARWRSAVGLEELAEDSAITQPVADARLNLGALHRAIAALPSDQAAVMTLVLAGTASPRTIAKTLGIPTGTAMSRLARARATLRSAIGLGTHERISELL